MLFKLKILYHLLKLRFNKYRYRNNIAQLQSLKWKKFQKLLRESLFYKSRNLINAPLGDFPIVNKELFMENFDSINTAGISREKAEKTALEAESSRNFSPEIGDITVGFSTGTSGNRGLFLASIDERAQWVAAILDRVIGFSLRHRTVAFFLRANSNLYTSVSSKILQFEFFDLLTPFEKQIAELEKLNPTILVAQPSMLMEIAQSIEQGELSIIPQKVISVAEVLNLKDKEYLTQIFKQTIHQVYQCTEGFLAASCKYGTLHFNEDFLIIEKKYLDEGKERFFPVITDLQRSTQPVIRYELNDIIHEKNQCECGSPFLAIESIEGRADDVFKFMRDDGSICKIYPDFIRRAIVTADTSVRHYQIRQTGASTIRLFVESNNNVYQICKASIDKILNEKFNLNNIRIMRDESLEFEKGTKLRRVKNEYN